MKKWLAFILAVVIFFTVHEGAHALIATIYSEYAAFHIGPIGLEVVFRTPVGERIGAKWAIISGISNLATITMGYLLLLFGQRFAHARSMFAKAGIYYWTILSLLLDPLNLSIGPFIYGGDANGIAAGLSINRYVIQAVFLGVFLMNRELVAQKLLPLFGVKTDYPLLRPCIRLKR